MKEWRGRVLGTNLNEAHPDIEPAHEDLPQYVTGDLEVDHVPSLGYDRFTINGLDVDPDSVEEMCCDGSGRTAAEHHHEAGHCCVDDEPVTKGFHPDEIRDWKGRWTKGGDVKQGDVLHHSKWGKVEVTSARKENATGHRVLVLKDSEGKLHSSQVHRDDKLATHNAAPPHVITDEEKADGEKTWSHSTTAEAAQSIHEHGFNASSVGYGGSGVYIAEDSSKYNQGGKVNVKPGGPLASIDTLMKVEDELGTHDEAAVRQRLQELGYVGRVTANIDDSGWDGPAGKEAVIWDPKHAHVVHPTEAIPNTEVKKEPGQPVEVTSSKSNPSFSDLMSYKKVPGPSGSNPIEWRQAPDGKTYAVKPTPATKAYNEVAAGAVYRLAGVPFPNTFVAKDPSGKTYLVSEKVEGLHQFTSTQWMQKPILQAKAAKDYGIDALLSHWDVHGLAADNTLVDEKGTPVRIESGGAMAYRAMGGTKPNWKQGGDWVEPKTMRTSEQGKRMYGNMSDQAAAESLQRAADINLDNLKAEWEKLGIPSDQIARDLAIIKERQQQIPGILAKLKKFHGVMPGFDVDTR